MLTDPYLLGSVQLRAAAAMRSKMNLRMVWREYLLWQTVHRCPTRPQHGGTPCAGPQALRVSNTPPFGCRTDFERIPAPGSLRFAAHLARTKELFWLAFLRLNTRA